MNKQGHPAIWEKHDFGQLEPKWTSEPSVDAIKSIMKQTLHIGETTPINISFLAQGAFSKLYSISIGAVNPEYVMRVSLPVDHHVKVESEAATVS